MKSPHEDPRYEAYVERIKREDEERQHRKQQEAERKAHQPVMPVKKVAEERREYKKESRRRIAVEVVVLLLLLAAIAYVILRKKPHVQTVSLDPALSDVAMASGLPPVITNSIGMVFRLLPPGIYKMGSPPEERGRMEREELHSASVPNPIYMAVTETTAAQYEKVMGTNPCFFTASGDLPAESMLWENTLEFCNALSRREGLAPAYELVGGQWVFYPDQSGYRLPVEVEWEYACRAGTIDAFYSGSILPLSEGKTRLARIGWYNENSGIKSRPVGQREPNRWGLYDMTGNVAEWCWDWFQPYASLVEHPFLGPPEGTFKILRGGGWISGMEECRSAAREYRRPSQPANFAGFRCVRPVTGTHPAATGSTP